MFMYVILVLFPSLLPNFGNKHLNKILMKALTLYHFIHNSLLIVDQWVIILRLRQNGFLFLEGIFKIIFFRENHYIVIKISLKFVSRGVIDNTATLVQIMVGTNQAIKPFLKPKMT